MNGKWEVVIGLEVHTQLATNSKIFSGASTAYGAAPNTQACLVDLGYPGVLPVLNAEVVRMAVKFGLAVNAKVASRSIFARKNYFYPDLPKGYQISQYELPIVGHGELFILDDNGNEKRIGITRAHLEEDAGKSVHEGFGEHSGIDLNRAGTPLLEIVSEPDMRSAREAVAYMRKIHTIVRYLEVSDGNMQEGSFRCDANVSVRPRGQKELGTRAELKNLNSFRFVEKAINFEIDRQIALIEDGGEVVQETRLYDSDKDETRPMRSKEEANDYRYFPDPDLLPVEIDDSFIEAVRKTLPELPDAKQQRFTNQYGLKTADAEILTASRAVSDYFEQVAEATTAGPQVAANWVIGDLSALLNKEGIEIKSSKIGAGALAGLLDRIADTTISGKIAKDVFESMWTGEGSADEIIAAKGLTQITDTSALESVVDAVIAANPEQVAEFRAGKGKLLGFFVGQVMKETGGKANPGQVNRIIKQKLG
ncbi:MAG: Asp-tRNA(Asn)/Glu-tRNA(Gln) amidotransferase subunit GatB [Proteobacteria bacterium]|nr:Asp-tRNA(Asn)/Glu-tRNA(Gln) amidotransferase subunit GatB [Pseudomonadota bacterium]MDA0993606.1 Asp-tRNA(Asn)/Glu-tRNA(Gln) amidotransferase subunit GatB [Pseudomonadota bacterium]